MSIVAAAGGNEVLAEVIFVAVFLGAGVPLALYLFRRSRFDPSDRLPPGNSAWPLVVAVGWGMLAWMTAQAGYFASRGLPSAGAAQTTTQPAIRPDTQPQTAPTVVIPPLTPPESKPGLAALPARDVAFLATVPHLAGFLAMLTLDLLVYRGRLGRLGFSLRQLPAGVYYGLAFSMVCIPLVFGGSVVAEWIYRAVGYSHPKQHDLLRVLGVSAEQWVTFALVAGATLAAPLAEELLFRGHIQTVLRRWLSPRSQDDGDGDDGAGNGGDGAATAPQAWATWGAIVLASAMFAAMHAPWTWPAIFLLSLCIGWLYERTGNLWAAVALHAAFNTTSTLIYLSFGGAN